MIVWYDFFCNVYEDVLSPESTMQRIGRCDRWGDLDVNPSITIYKKVPCQNSTNDLELKSKIQSVFPKGF